MEMPAEAVEPVVAAVQSVPAAIVRPVLSGPLPVEANWKWWHTLTVIIFPVTILIFPLVIIVFGIPLPSSLRLGNWLLNLVLFAAFIIFIGKGITGRWSGLLIDDRYKMSLSRLQTIAWTVLVLSAFITAVLTNMSSEGPFSAFKVGIPEQLWLLLGISTTSLIGSSLVLGVKKQQPSQPPPSPDKLTKGPIVYNQDIKKASWSDIFKGEEVSNDNVLDLGKVQMFYFTVLLVFGYGVALALIFIDSNQKVISMFPDPSMAVTGLLGISQAAYLINKALPRPGSPPSP